MRKPIDRCPHCGSTEGIYTKSTYKNVIWGCEFDGKDQDNSNMYENVTIEGGNLAYCQDCNKLICRLSTLQKQWGSR